MYSAADGATPIYAPNGGRPPRPAGKAERLVTMDVLRGFALLGILVLNIDSFFGPESLHDIPMGVAKAAFVGWHAQLDYCILTVKWLFFEGKMRAMFAMLFGAGCVLLTERIERQGNPSRAADIFARRNMWLVLFGLIHGALIWSGDILSGYGLCALLFIYPLRNIRPKLLIGVGTFITLVFATWGLAVFTDAANVLRADTLARQAVAAKAEGRVPSVAQQAALDAEIKAKREEPGNIAEQVKQSRQPYLEGLSHRADGYFAMVLAQLRSLFIVEYLGLMMLGMGLFKSGFLSGRLSTRTYVMTALVSYGISVPVALVGVFNAAQTGFSPGGVMRWMYLPYYLQVLPGMIGNASLVLLIVCHGWLAPLTRSLANVGRTAFSNYILTSLICQTLFVWGPWKLYGTLEYYQQLYVVGGVWVVNLVASALWLRFFAYGPLEWVWRSLTYWKRQPLTLSAARTARLGALFP